MVSPTDIEFDQKMEYQVQALDKHNSDESDSKSLLISGISRVLESIDHSKYLPLFIEHEIDYQTFLALEDGDLKELGIKALGSRKKILSMIRECRQKEKKNSPEQRMGKGFDF
jgi:SAM domain (Sterile alpha motif)